MTDQNAQAHTGELPSTSTAVPDLQPKVAGVRIETPQQPLKKNNKSQKQAGVGNETPVNKNGKEDELAKLKRMRDILLLEREIETLQQPTSTANENVDLKTHIENIELQYQKILGTTNNELTDLVDTIFIKCLYKTMDKDIMTYIGAQAVIAARDLHITPANLSKYMTESDLVSLVLRKMSACKTWNNVSEVNKANLYNCQKNGKVPYRKWWNPFKIYQHELTDDLGFQQQESALMDRNISYSPVPGLVKGMLWVAGGCLVAYGTYRLCKYLMNSSTIHLPTSLPLPDSTTGTQPSALLTTNPNSFQVSISTSGNSFVIQPSFPALNTPVPSVMQESASIIQTMPQPSMKTVPESEATSWLLPSWKKLEAISIKLLDLSKQGMSHLTSSMEDGLKHLKSKLPNTTNSNTDLAKVITTKLQNELINVQKGFATPLKLTTPSSMPTLPENILNCPIDFTKPVFLIVHKSESYHASLLRILSELSKVINGRLLEQECRATSIRALETVLLTTPF